ncbi:hypothetical protein C8R44DRAFT_725048 [Mycena epipterygia]|nr:hypothetical protein C8R44DRAFT_725048 [Mycena epipterygia]
MHLDLHAVPDILTQLRPLPEAPPSPTSLAIVGILGHDLDSLGDERAIHGTVAYSLMGELSPRRLFITSVVLGWNLYPGAWAWGNFAGFLVKLEYRRSPTGGKGRRTWLSGDWGRTKGGFVRPTPRIKTLFVLSQVLLVKEVQEPSNYGTHAFHAPGFQCPLGLVFAVGFGAKEEARKSYAPAGVNAER